MNEFIRKKTEKTKISVPHHIILHLNCLWPITIPTHWQYLNVSTNFNIIFQEDSRLCLLIIGSVIVKFRTRSKHTVSFDNLVTFLLEAVIIHTHALCCQVESFCKNVWKTWSKQSLALVLSMPGRFILNWFYENCKWQTLFWYKLIFNQLLAKTNRLVVAEGAGEESTNAPTTPTTTAAADDDDESEEGAVWTAHQSRRVLALTSPPSHQQPET